ncbi:hypothetical protein BJ508DRAFT_333542 [Ascobolus immersus RN42]|uniref:F-box domain-containing protein n=1 Tax=Ascobolus immersus RN42 TaxID=1160509 RepID=A0A3N4HJ80_ASCIM|nr:hypothetical protein BJ508DRAFT_333542 [Ascobolus immersus RN42]
MTTIDYGSASANPQTKPAETKISFRSLPLELRHQIFSSCTVLGLLILSHTCHAMYVDINSNPHLVQQSEGYLNYVECWPLEISKPHPMLPAGAIPLTVRMISYYDKVEEYCGRDPLDGYRRREWSLFNEVYGGCHRDHPDQCQNECWWACGGCDLIRRKEDFPWIRSISIAKYLDYRGIVQVSNCKDCWV